MSAQERTHRLVASNSDISATRARQDRGAAPAERIQNESKAAYPSARKAPQCTRNVRLILDKAICGRMSDDRRTSRTRRLSDHNCGSAKAVARKAYRRGERQGSISQGGRPEKQGAMGGSVTTRDQRMVRRPVQIRQGRKSAKRRRGRRRESRLSLWGSTSRRTQGRR